METVQRFFKSPYVMPGVKFDRNRSIEYLFTNIMQVISEVTGYTHAELSEYNRKREKVLARYAAFFVLKQQVPSMSLVSIGKKFQDTNGKFRDHTTVLHGINTFKDLLHVDDVAAWVIYN